MKPLLHLIFKSFLVTCFLCFVHIGQAQTALSVSITDSLLTACQDDAFASLNVSGGTAPYTAYWIQYNQNPPAGGPNGADTVATGLSVTGLSAGYYSVVVYDSSTPQQLVGNTGVYIQPSFNVYSTATPATCANADGVLRIVIQNAVGPFDVEWSNGENHFGITNPSDSILNVAAGSYNARVTDYASGCWVNGGSAGTSGQGLYMYATSPITATSSATASNCFDGTATVVAANGTEPYSYVWTTSPAQFGATATGLSPGYVYCTITDAEGCSRQQYVNVPAGPNYLQITSSITSAQCQGSTGAIQLTVSGGVSPYSYTWSNGATTEDVSSLSSGSYQVSVTDAQGCTIQLYKYVPSSSPLDVDVSGSYTGCLPGGGQTDVTVAGGNPPYSYQWSNQVTTALNSNLDPGYYGVLVTDSDGCTGYDYTHLQLEASCYVQLRGKVFNDLNGNCVQDNGEGVIPNVLVNAGPGYHYATTDASGNYQITAEPGQYDISIYTPQNWSLICPDSPQSIPVDASNPGTTYSGNNFYLQPDSVFNDIAVYVSSGPARPGFPVHWYVNVRNLGTTTLSPLLSLEHDALATYQGSSPAVTTYNAASHTATWQLSPLQALQNRSFYLYTTLSTSAVIADSVRATAEVSLSAAASEVDMLNNIDYYARLITGSYDPNDKAVQPRGLGEEGFILYDDTTFHYTIRFQNTGNDTAFTVVIRDTLDAGLDVPSFRLDEASHPIDYSISGPGYVEFRFNQILLPDSFVNEPASHGLVSYFINRKPDLALGTEIRNTAAIYFDFNAPIYTNTTLNTVFDPTVGIAPVNAIELGLRPNPAQSLSVVQLNLPESAEVRYELMDVTGKLVQQKNMGILSSGEHSWTLNGLPSGVYLLRVQVGAQSKTQRLVFTK